MKGTKICKYIFLVFFIFISNAFSIDNSWEIGSSCSTQGSWTQTALFHLNNLVHVIKMYKDDDKCKNEVNDSIQKFTNLDSAIKLYLKAKNSDEDKLERYINDIVFLHDNSTTNFERDYYSEILVQSNAELAAVKSGHEEQSLTINEQHLSNAISNIYGYLASSLQAIPSKECLVERPNQVLPIIGSVIHIASAFAGSPFALAGGLAAKLISNIVNYMRDRRFQKAIEIGELAKLRSSLQCAIETLSDDYCSAAEMQKVLYWDAQYENLNINISPDSYWAGYMVYSEHFPRVLNWLSKTIGFLDPQSSSDIDKQNEALSIEAQVRKTNELLPSILKFSKLEYDRDAITLIDKIDHIVNTLLWLDQRVTGYNRTQTANQSWSLHSVYQDLFKHEYYSVNTFIYWLIDHPMETVLSYKDACKMVIPPLGQACDWNEHLKIIIKNKYHDNPDQFFHDMEIKISTLKRMIAPELEKILERVKAKDKILLMAKAYDKSNSKAVPSVFESFKYIEEYLVHLQRNLDSNSSWKNPVLRILLLRLVPRFQAINFEMNTFKEFVESRDDSEINKIVETNNRASALLKKVAYEFKLDEERERFITTNITQIVSNDYMAKIKIKDFELDSAESIIRISRGNLISTVRQLSSLGSEFLSVSEARDISEEGLKSLITVFENNLGNALKYYREKELNDNQLHTAYTLRSRLCTLLQAFPSWPANIDINMCRGSILLSVYNLYAPLRRGEEYNKFRKSLNIYFDEHTNDSFERRVCQFYNYRKRDRLFRYYRNMTK